jgi:hypothetical protein
MFLFKYPEFGFPIFQICRFCFTLACGLSFVERDPEEGKRVVQKEDNSSVFGHGTAPDNELSA